MFQLSKAENKILRRQFGTLRWDTYSKYLPRAFTEEEAAGELGEASRRESGR